MILYPAQNSSAVLVGALFFDTSFPNFVGGVPSPISPMTPIAVQQPSRHYQQRVVSVPAYGGASPHRHAHSLSPHSNPDSPIEQPIAAHRQDPYRYVIPRSGHSTFSGLGQPSSSDVPTWPGIKIEDDNGYANYASSHQNPPYT
jgi:hypothetical protein